MECKVKHYPFYLTTACRTCYLLQHEILKFPHMELLQIENRRRQRDRPDHASFGSIHKGAVIVEPWDPMYRLENIVINPEDPAASVLAVGE